MSVATGIAPSELMELDADMWDALDRAVSDRWGPELELAASTVELVSALLVGYTKVHLRRGARFTGEPIEVPRPEWWREAAKGSPGPVTPARVGVSALAELAGKSIQAPEVTSG